MKLALATCDFFESLYPGDQALARALEERGAHTTPWVWDQPRPDGIDAVVIRSPWDYHRKASQFRRWLDELEASSTPVINPVPMLRWNLDKKYLFELEARGVAIPKTRWVEARTPLEAVMSELAVETCVVKPAVSAGGDDTFIVRAASAAEREPEFSGLLGRGPLLVQEYIPEVSEGEISLVFFAGEYSHSVLKRAAKGEFRIHVEHGGTVEVAQPTESVIEQARKVVTLAGSTPAYARVDGLLRADQLLLMELELVEPELFFDARPGSADLFAGVLLAQLADRKVATPEAGST